MSLINLLFLFCLCCLIGCANDINPLLKDTSQNLFDYFDATEGTQPLLTPQQQTVLAEKFLSHYFSPWSGNDRLWSNAEILQQRQKNIERLSQNPGWGANHLPHSQVWIQQLIQQMDLAHFPNTQQKAITITPTYLRVIPTEEPSFTYWEQAGEGYPFDNLQISYQSANMPILVLHTTKDKAWSLILTANAMGWIPSNTLAYVDDNFIKQWQTKEFVALIQDKIPIYDAKQQFQFYTYLGAIHPLRKVSSTTYEILLAKKSTQDKAIIETSSISKQAVAVMPFALTLNNLARLGNSLIGTPYGWGGWYGFRDCSSTLMDLLAPFGIWLPRNSWEQLQTGKFISLADMSNQKKITVISEQAKPFLSIIGWKGHVMLYLGTKNKKMYVFHNKWGLISRTFSGKEGRLIIGKTIISPLDLGKGYLNIKYNLLDKVDSLTILDIQPFP